MAGLLLLAASAVVFLLYLADRAVKARIQAWRLRRMTRRLTAAAARSERQQAQRPFRPPDEAVINDRSDGHRQQEPTQGPKQDHLLPRLRGEPNPPEGVGERPLPAPAATL